MDSITHAALGAAIGELVIGKYGRTKGMLLGAAVATIPDLDILGYFIYSKFEMLSIHRGVSHSIVFTVFCSVLLGVILKRVGITKRIPVFQLCLFSWLVLFTHILLDACTAYGTQLFLPFTDTRYGWDFMNIVDIVYTVPLILGVLGTILLKKSYFNRLGLIVSTIYLLVALLIKCDINNRLSLDVDKEELQTAVQATIPVGSASLHWFGMARNNDKLYLKRYSLLNQSFSDFYVFDVNDVFLDELSPKQKDVMIWFAKGFYTVKKEKDAILIYNLKVDTRGVIQNESTYAPTKGYFKFVPQLSGGYQFSSGVHE